MNERIDLLGCPFDSVTEKETVELVFEWKNAEHRKSHHIVTVNVAILMMARNDAKLTNAIERADLVVVDGKPLVWTSKWLGSAVPEKVSGVDLMRRLLQAGDDRGLSIFLLGTTQERLDVLERVIRAKYPNVVIAGTRNGYFKEPDYAAVTKQIRDAKADLLLVGMPAPFKEIWCEEHREALSTPAILGVGGAFDVLAGFVPRAPRLMQEAGLEWAWRLAMEPRKLWKRYLVTNSAFIALLGKTLATQRFAIRRR
ncbi:MAG TPA: WecB/TagA/CpsF family glycosyltransferase [Labilithrix sp.]|jgi:N-acetylglucosaminyldiphosphoundecaprenol N-acetyl-beta-D-mannosaminyltransferase|nr:WecB/TagA/CpsF family glycosyltransferase [Labilithrix sp.]